MNYIRHISYATLVALAAVSAAHAMDNQNPLADLTAAIGKKYDQTENKALRTMALEYYKSDRRNADAQALFDAITALNAKGFGNDLAQAERDQLLLAAVYDQNVDGIPALVTRRHNGEISQPLAQLVGFEARFQNDKEEQDAIARVTALLADKKEANRFYFGWHTRSATIAEVAQSGVLLAGCIKKSRAQGSCAAALTAFLAKFDAIMKNCHAIINEDDRADGATDKEIKEVFSPVHTFLLRSARIIVRAIEAKPEAVNGVDHNALSRENLTNHSKAIKLFVDPAQYQEHEGEEGNGFWGAWDVNPFAGVMQALEAVTVEEATKDEKKIELLTILVNQAKKIASLTKTGNDIAEAHLDVIVQAFNAKLRSLFNDENNMVTFINNEAAKAAAVYLAFLNINNELCVQIKANPVNQDIKSRFVELRKFITTLYTKADAENTRLS